MVENGKFYPKEENLGEECKFWRASSGCIFPKATMEGRRSCEGIIDDVCLYLKNKRIPQSLTSEQMLEIEITPPRQNKAHIPPGDTQKY